MFATIEHLCVRARRASWAWPRLLRILSLLAFSAVCCGFSIPAMAADAPPAMIVPGQFNVSATGASTYTVPIAVPPGTAGMVPALSLDYSSQSGDGIVGLGWTLSGLPSITRCPRTYAQDNVHGSVNYDNNDRFCMEGQRLVAISGTYGADSTQYRTEIDGFTKIISYGSAGNGPAYFKVWTKSGQIMEFGNTTDSRLLAVGTSTARSWAVDKISDTVGNYLTVTYTNDTTNGQAYPTRIDYTGNANTALSSYNSVQFTYNTSRPDVTPTYQAGALQQTTVLLTDVKTYQGSNLVHDYQLSYRLGSSTTHSRLTSVTLCDANNSCLAPTTFTWQGGTGTLTPTASTPNPALISSGSSNLIFGDFNGDGLLDIIPWFSSSQTCGVQFGTQSGAFVAGGPSFSFHTYEYFDTTPPTWHAVVDDMCTGQQEVDPYTLDLNGDGFSDLAIIARDASGNPYHKFLLNSGGTSSTEGASTFPYATAWQLGDFDGDGRGDLLITGASSYVDYSNGDGTFTTGSAIAGLQGAYVTRIPADFDGDGCTDILVQGSGYTPIIQYFCNPAVSQASVPNWLASGYTIILGDFNGDGKTDVLAVNASGATLYLSTGTGFSAGYSIPGSSTWSNYTITAGDFNGDGRADLVLIADGVGSHYGITTPHQIWLSTGSGFVEAATIANSGNSADNPVSGIAQINARVGRWNNDGADELWIEKPSGDVVYSFSYLPELVTSVSNGIGATTTITYDRLNKNGSLYTKCPNSPSSYACGDTYPTVGLDGPFYVVSRVDASNGIGGTYSSTYAYAGAKSDLRGRGFLGFQSVTATDLQTGVIQTTNYHTDFPFIGLISSQTKTSGSVTLNSTTNTFADSSEGTGTDGVPYHFVSLSQSVVASNDLDGTALPTSTTAYTYDGYGNALTVNVSLSDGSSKDTTNTYSNDTTNWFLGRLTSTSVTSTVPDTGTGGTSGNSPPTATNDSVTTNENTPVTFDPRTNDSDPDGDALTIIATSAPGHGTVVINNGTSLTYTPTSMYSGSDSFTYTISDGQGHAVTATISMTITYVAPPSGTFTASASPIAPGNSSTLSWTSSGATSASIDNGIGNVTPVSGGSVTVTPSATTTYTLTLTGLGGTTTKQVTVTVTPPPTGSFSASPATIGVGSSSTLSWSSANATSASIDNGVGSVTPVASGSVNVTPSVTTTYTLTLTGPTGTITKQTTVTVIGTPSGSLSASPTTVNLGSPSTLTWSSVNATSTSINNGVGTVSPASGGSVTVTPSATTTYTLTMTGLAGTNTATATVTIPAPTGSFSASPTAIVRGNSTTLSWSSTNATSASIDNGVGGVSTNGSLNVSPTSTTTYTLTLTGPSGTITKQATVTVYQPPTASLSTSPTTVNLGSSTTLSWSTTNATSTSIDNGIGGVSPASSGSVTVTPSASTTYTLTASGQGGTATAQASVTIPGPSGSFSASPTAITQGNSSTLSWSSSNATSASIDNGVGGVATNGSVNVSPGSTTTYTLTLTGPSGSTTRQVTVTVYPPPSGSMSASPSSIGQGSSSTLSWSSSNAVSASIDNGVGGVSTSGSVNVSPSSTTTYTLTLTNATGTQSTSSATVNVYPPPSGSLSANPSAISQGSSSTLNWSASNATSASIDNGVGGVSASGGSTNVSPSATTTYTLTLTNAVGVQATSSTTVSVNTPPVAVNDSESYRRVRVPAGQLVRPTVSFDVLTNDSDPDGDTLTVISTTNGTYGSVTNNGSGYLTYTYNTQVNSDTSTTDQFTYTISDGHGLTSTATVTVTVNVTFLQ